MRYLFAIVLVLSMVGAAAAYDLGNAPPEKTDVYPDYVNPDVRQGGDTIDDATVIGAIPYDNVGTTSGYSDDYDEVCPYSISTSPDVVYTFTPAGDLEVDIDLLGSTYDTKLYVYDADLNLVACNDDFYSDFVSKLQNVALLGGIQYFIIIDGYGGDYGEYVMAITEGTEPCFLECPPEGFPEGEPDLVDGYWDEYNFGCAGGPPWVFQNLNFGPSFINFCGVAGWYIYEGGNFRDTDWFEAVVGENGFIEITADAESATYIFELEIPEDCNGSVIQNILVGPCSPATMIISGAPGSVVFPWVGTYNFTNPGDVPGNMYEYILTLDGLEGSATEPSTWSQVKGLYR